MLHADEMSTVDVTWRYVRSSENPARLSRVWCVSGDTRVALSLLWLQRITEAQFYGYRCDEDQLMTLTWPVWPSPWQTAVTWSLF